MDFLRGLLVGLAALVAVVSLFTGGMGMFHLDARWLMVTTWFLSLPIMAATFLAGFAWRLSSHKHRGDRRE